MKIAVCMKAVPSTTQVRLDPVTHTLIRDGRQSVINPFDAAALEAAVRIKEQLGGEVTVLSMGIPDTVRLLRDALGRGADRGVLLSDRAFAGADTLATSYTLGRALEKLQPLSLILCGKMAVDGDTAQIGPEIAASLGIPCVTDVTEIVQVTPESIRVRRRADGRQILAEIPLPAVITVVKDICQPRMPSISSIRFAQSGPVDVVNALTLEADGSRCGLKGSPTQVVKVFVPERKQECIFLEGSPAEQAAAIRKLAEEVEA